MGYIYKITNTLNGKVYVGQTRRSIRARWNEHVKNAHKPLTMRGRSIFRYAILKYGEDSFTVEELEQCDNELLNEREIYWIAKYHSTLKENGYNLTPGGMGGIKFREGRKVAQFDLNGNFINSYDSMAQAARAVNGNKDAIGNCCNGRTKHSGIYQWRYLEEAKVLGMKLDPIPFNPKAKPVYQYTMDWEFVAEYPSAHVAESIFNVSCRENIQKACRGKANQYRGYKWSYEKIGAKAA